MDRIADGGWAECAVHEYIADQILGEPKSDTAPDFTPMLIAHGRNNGPHAGDRGVDSGRTCERLNEPAIEIDFNPRTEQMSPLAADFRQVGAVRATGEICVERIGWPGHLLVTIDLLPALPQFRRHGELIAR